MNGKVEATRAVVQKIWDLTAPLVTAEGMELIEVEYRRESQGWVLRLFVDRDDGVSVEDCASVSRMVSDLLDVEDPIPGPYHLEVSSPGLNRPLRRWEHFQRQIGNVISVRTRLPIESRKNFKGTLVAAHPEGIRMECDGTFFDIPLNAVERARLRYFESSQRTPKPMRSD
ncbi:ribosome maturation factor RimP [Desulfosoma caldarium]|uniref:Ribosome maturation factor RimP n=1 Tax=Desulfosoma caldarium TaxID=610254 RepID=A0A3N1UJB4_9BACT|nr:ribosome maturation factor RimP [Desulfosoma caldarium]ROQ90193.1 ribosome maturation factor RimP [Desulfosoma caldarium]